MTQLTHEPPGHYSFTPNGHRTAAGWSTRTSNPGQASNNFNIMDLRTGAVSVIWHGTAGTFDEDPAWSPRP
jgi:hypothetical protein